MTERDPDGRADGSATFEDDSPVDLTGELVRVTDDDIQAGILMRLAYSDRDIVVSGIAGTVVIAGIFARAAPLWQVLPFIGARLAAAYGTHLLAQRVLHMGAPAALRRGYLMGMELWFAAIALSWSCAIFLAPSPVLSRPESVLGVVAVIAVEGVTVLVASVSKRTILIVVGAFWSSLTLRALLDTGEGRTPFIVCIALYHVVLTMHAFNLQRQTVKNVRSEIVNRVLLDRVTQLHSRVRQHRDQLATVNAQLADALEQSTELANYDSLTGVLNRRAFLERVVQEETAMQRHPRPATLVLLDIDGFKAVNDIHGHATGDDVLACCAAILRDEMRASDVFARWGGEEFVALLPNTEAADAAVTAERYRLAIERADCATWPEDLHITASFGVAEFQTPEAFDAALAAADKALYAAKAAGRNTVCVAPTTAPPS